MRISDWSSDVCSSDLIFLAKIKKWDDAAIKALNPDMKLPSTSIIVVHRSDGSGTTFGWTNYLSKVSPAWKEQVGEGKAVKWPKIGRASCRERVCKYVYISVVAVS